MNPVEVTWDHQGLYLDQSPFYPIISDERELSSANAILIHLQADLQADLNWKEALEKARASKLKILWELDFGLDNLEFPLEDELQFATFKLALFEFVNNVYPEFSNRSLGIVFFRGSTQIHTHFPWNEAQWKSWLKERFSSVAYLKEELGFAFQSWDDCTKDVFALAEDGLHYLNLYSADLLVDYLQLFTPALPQELPIYLLFKNEQTSPAKLADLFSPDRFEHFVLAVQGSLIPLPTLIWKQGRGTMGGIDLSKEAAAPVLGVCMPSKRDPEILIEWENLLSHIQVPYRIVYEKFLTECWEGLDFIIVQEKAVSPAGKRKLMGFCAAGGTIVVEGKTLNLPSEVSMKEFTENRGRGI